ncbi:MAG: MFS transporter [Pirellulales bacterium]|nr:MFS transporter [Pirellulales bacterium]
MSDAGSTLKPDPYAAWRVPAFRLLAVSWFSIMFAKMIETVAVGVSIYELTGDPLQLGWVGLVQALPVILLSIAGGQLADRFDRRLVIICAIALGILASVGLLLRVLYDWPLWWMYVFLGIGAVAQALGGPSRSALLPQVVPKEIFSNAITWNSTVFHASIMVGPAVGGLILGSQNEHVAAAFLVVVVCKMLSLATVCFLKSTHERADAQSISLESLIAGIRFVGRTKLILATITLDLFAVLFGGATYLLPVFAKDFLHVNATGLGVLRSMEAVGAVFMAMLIAHLPLLRRAGWTLLWAVAGFGAATIGFGLSRWYWLSLLMMFAIGALDNISVVVRHTLVQMLTPNHMRGRVSAVNSVFIVASNDIGGFESGLTARLFGPVISVVGGGICTIFVVLASAKIWPEILSIGSLQDVKPADAAQAEKSAEEESADRYY